jgi:hypothetical protein
LSSHCHPASWASAYTQGIYMRHAIVFAVSLVVSSAAWSQSGSGGPTPIGGGGAATGTSVAKGPGSGGPAGVQCIAKLASLATDKLRAQLLLEKAVTKQVMNNATITEAQLGAACEQTCASYDYTVSKIQWAKTSPSQVLGSPGYLEQLKYKNMPMPAMRGQADLDTCMPATSTAQWCPTSGSGIGAQPGARQTNPLDGLSVCMTQTDALSHMKNFDLPYVGNCKRPNITDAADRIKEEKACVAIAVQAKAAQDAAAIAAANKAAAVYSGPTFGSTPAVSTLTGGVRPKP